MNKFLYGCLLFIFLFALLGELGRLPFGPVNGILPNDILVGITVIVWVLKKILVDRKWPKTSIGIPFLAFSSLAAISLIHGSQFLTPRETLISGFYWIRFVEYFCLIFIALDLTLWKTPSRHSPTPILNSEKLFNLILYSGLGLCIIGFLQLHFFPDFTQQQDYGWDPHINRLLATWFDPNFVGGILAFLVSLNLARWDDSKKSLLVKILENGILLTALFLTYSRSAYIALIVSLGIIGMLKSKKIIAIGLIAGMVMLSVSERAQERMSNLVHSAVSILSETQLEFPDATARLRINSWKNTIAIFKDHPMLGVGYNAFGFTQKRYSFIKEDTDHSATGSDATLLTILATTGILGTLAYAWLLISMLGVTFKNRNDALNLGFFAGLCGLLVHSIFVNSLLYMPLLIFVYTTLGITLGTSIKAQTKHHDLQFLSSSSISYPNTLKS